MDVMTSELEHAERLLDVEARMDAAGLTLDSMAARCAAAGIVVNVEPNFEGAEFPWMWTIGFPNGSTAFGADYLQRMAFYHALHRAGLES